VSPLPNGHPIPAWQVHENALDLAGLARTESMFALSNGHVGLRGNLDEGEPHGIPGTYLNSVFESRPLPYAEPAYGDPESGQTMVNISNGKLIRLLVDDEPFDVRYGSLARHERTLDLRDGTLTRVAQWRSPADRTVLVRSQRLVSFTHRSIAAISYVVEPIDGPARVVLQSELVVNEQLPLPVGLDPRAAAVLQAPFVPIEHDAMGSRLTLLHHTRSSGITVAAAADHQVTASPGVRLDLSSEAQPDWARFTVTAQLEPGQQLQLVKFISYGWSRERSVPALRDQVAAALTGATHTGWQGLCDDQRAYLDDFWHHADVEVDGDPELQQAVRFGLFHVLQSGARAEERPISAKGLTGSGYDGHCFWDSETFVLPVLLHSAPHAVADALRWRHSTLGLARERARTLGLRGAAFPWRTIDGTEASGYWPAGTAAFHVNADIADAVVRYHLAVGDPGFEEAIGIELLVETARLWESLGQHEDGGFRIDGVTGPDEYSAIADNNVYTNLMAIRNLRGAIAAVAGYPARARDLGVEPEEVARWEAAAKLMVIPFNRDLGVHEQAEGFTRHARLDLTAFGPDQYPLLLHVPYFQLYRTQVVKQADLVLAMFLCGEAFTPEQKAANFAYYEPLTVRDSSLSACVQAVIAAEVGHLELAYDYAWEAASMDLQDLHHNTRDGLHIASLAGAWIALVCGLGGMRDDRDDITFAPRLPRGLTRLAFSVTHRGARLRVTTDGREATYLLSETSGTLTVVHHGEPVELSAGTPVTRPVPPIDPGPAPAEPPGRAPRRRGSRG